MNCTEAVSHYVADSNKKTQLPESLNKSKYCVLDWIANVFAGMNEHGTQKVANLSNYFGDREQCTVVGFHYRFPLLVAALVNGTSASALDFDDIVSYEPGHTTATVVAASLALGEQRRIGGRQLLSAIICGVQVMNSIGAAIMPLHYKIGWHNTSTMGHFGAVAACASVLQLNDAQVRHALGIVSSSVAGTQDNFGTMTKPFHSGKSAMNGAMAALLAETSFSGNDAILDGGFLEKYTPEINRDKLIDFLNGPDLIDTLRFKQFPCGVATHPAIIAVKRIKSRTQVTPDQIESIDVSVYPNAFQCAIIRHPKTGLEGKFSMYYVIARTLLFGNVDVGSFSDAAVGVEELRPVIDKITLHERVEYQDTRSTTVTICKTDATTITETVNMLQEMADREAQNNLVIEKYENVLASFMDKENVESLQSTVWNLENVTDINSLTLHMRELL